MEAIEMLDEVDDSNPVDIPNSGENSRVARGGVRLVPFGWLAPCYGQSDGFAKGGWRCNGLWLGTLSQLDVHQLKMQWFFQKASRGTQTTTTQFMEASMACTSPTVASRICSSRRVHVPDAEVQRMQHSRVWPEHDPTALLLPVARQARLHSLRAP